ncbi:MAG: phosphopentomutase, partial [Microvirga sp.]
VIITADHGNDPSWQGSDHTREHVPILSFGRGITQGAIGRRQSFADIGASVLAHLGVSHKGTGAPWL